MRYARGQMKQVRSYSVQKNLKKITFILRNNEPILTVIPDL